MIHKIARIIIVSIILTVISSGTIHAADESCNFTCPKNTKCYLQPQGGYWCAPATNVDPNNVGGQVVGRVLPPYPVEQSPNAISNYMPIILNALMGFGVVGAFGYLVLGGIKWITAGGDAKALQAARDTIVNAVIGVILLSCALVITNIFALFGNAGQTYELAPDASGNPVTTTTIYICGYNTYDPVQQEECKKPANIHSPACSQCARPVTVTNFDKVTNKSQLCYSQNQCDNGCLANNRMNPPTYVNCLPAK